MQREVFMATLTNAARVTVDVLGAAVRPGILIARDRAIALTNETKALVRVFVPGCGDGHVTDIAPGATETITLAAIGVGIHAFAVFSQEADDFARGNSSPKIIIQ
jgi:hypothetical protein